MSDLSRVPGIGSRGAGMIGNFMSGLTSRLAPSRGYGQPDPRSEFLRLWDEGRPEGEDPTIWRARGEEAMGNAYMDPSTVGNGFVPDKWDPATQTWSKAGAAPAPATGGLPPFVPQSKATLGDGPAFNTATGQWVGPPPPPPSGYELAKVPTRQTSRITLEGPTNIADFDPSVFVFGADGKPVARDSGAVLDGEITVVRKARGGLTRESLIMTGDATDGRDPWRGGAKPEVIANPTNAPIGVLNSQETRSMIGGGGPMRGGRMDENVTPGWEMPWMNRVRPMMPAMTGGGMTPGNMGSGWGQGGAWGNTGGWGDAASAAPPMMGGGGLQLAALLQRPQRIPRYAFGTGLADILGAVQGQNPLIRAFSQPAAAEQPAAAPAGALPATFATMFGSARPAAPGSPPVFRPPTRPVRPGPVATLPGGPPTTPPTAPGGLQLPSSPAPGSVGAILAPTAPAPLVSEIEAFRRAVATGEYNPYALDYFEQDPVVRAGREAGFQTRYGIPAGSTAAEAARYRLNRIGRGGLQLGA